MTDQTSTCRRYVARLFLSIGTSRICTDDTDIDVMVYCVSAEVFSIDRQSEGVRKAGFTLLNCVLSFLQSMFRGCERDHQLCGSGSSSVVSYLLFTSPHYCTRAGAGGSVNIINMTVISPVPHCMEKLVLGRKMKHLSQPTSLLLELLCCEHVHSTGLDKEQVA